MDNIAVEDIKDLNLIGTYNSIDELYRTPNLIKRPEIVRKSIQAMMTYSKETIFYPPFIYLKHLADENFKYNILENHGVILEFTKRVANGESILPGKEEAFKSHIADRRLGLKKISDIFNTESAKIKPRIKNTQKHRSEDSSQINQKLINLLIKQIPNHESLPNTFNWNNIELFMSVLKIFLNDLEIGKIKAKENDWYDLFNLIYVSPNDKYWTLENKWKDYIKQTGLVHYIKE